MTGCHRTSSSSYSRRRPWQLGPPTLVPLLGSGSPFQAAGAIPPHQCATLYMRVPGSRRQDGEKRSLRILFLSQTFPFPPNRGDRLKAYQLVKNLSLHNDIHLFTFYQPDDEFEPGREELRKYCSSIVTHPVAKVRSASAVRYALSYLAGTRPFFIRRYDSPDARALVERMCAQIRPDLCHFELLGTAALLPAVGQLPTVLGATDDLSVAESRSAGTARNPLRRLYRRHQARAIRTYQSTVLGRFDRCIFVAQNDLSSASARSPDSRCELIPNGVDTAFFSPAAPTEGGPPCLVFTGNMGGEQSIDAVEYSSQRILPIVRVQFPAVRFIVAGSDPSRHILDLSKKHDFEVTRRVPDIRPYLARASVYVCPIRTGTGFKNRLAEAMAMARPAVATTISAAGLPGARDDTNMLLADNAEQFAAKVLRL